jgi:CHASE3 domain sensor protein
MLSFIKQNAIRVAIVLVSILILIGASLSYYNRYSMNKALIAKEQTESVLKEIDRIHDNIRFMDISARGYALIRKDGFLFWKVQNAEQQNTEIFNNLDSLFELQGFQDPNYGKMKVALIHYTGIFSKMVDHLQHDDLNQYLIMLDFDYGKQFYQTFEPFLASITEFESQMTNASQKQYESAVARNRIVQVLLFLVGFPTLVWMLFKLSKDERARKALLLDLEKNNKQYLFNNGNESDNEPALILQTSIHNLKQASQFVTEISHGNYEVDWIGLSNEIAPLNSNNLAGRLISMRDEMKRMKLEDQKRMWATQGLSELSELIRKFQNNLNELNYQVLTFLVKYSKSQQGGLFVLKTSHDKEQHLELAACYAYERKKVIEKAMKIGEGLVGQTFLEGQTTLLRKVPVNYINITSGLGHATPGCVVIVPMKHNDHVQAILELASFAEYQPHEIAFFEKAGEFVASAIFAAEQNEKNKQVMEQLVSQTEQLRSQEEELRQNIEELEATQEVMKRQGIKVLQEELVGV